MDQPTPSTPPVFTQTPIEPEQAKKSFLSTMLFILLFLTLISTSILAYQNLQLRKQIKQLRTSSLRSPLPSPSPTIYASPEASGKTDCPAKRPQVCTMECLQPPPYLCGSDGKSYCSVCQACSNPIVKWYIFQNDPCSSED